jgi:hypothetical protein
MAEMRRRDEKERRREGKGRAREEVRRHDDERGKR